MSEYSQVHYVISSEVAVNVGFDAFLDTLMYLMLKTGCFHFFVKLKMAAIFVYKIATKFSIFRLYLHL